MRLIVGIDPKPGNGLNQPGHRVQALNRAIIIMVLGIAAITCGAGVIFLIYLVKSLAGIDIFPYEHLLK